MVPEPRDRPPAGGVDDLVGSDSGQVRTHLGDHAVGDPQVDRPVDGRPARTGPDRHEPRPADQHTVGRTGWAHGASLLGRSSRRSGACSFGCSREWQAVETPKTRTPTTSSPIEDEAPQDDTAHAGR